MEKRLKFKKNIYYHFKPYANENNKGYLIINSKDEYLGHIYKYRLGAFINWVFEANEGCYFSGGCLDEVRAFMKNPTKYLEKYPKCEVRK